PAVQNAGSRVFGDQALEQFESSSKALERKGDSGFTRFNGKSGFGDNVTRINLLIDKMPRNAMVFLAVVDRPGRDVDSAILRQRSIVEVNDSVTRNAQYGLVQDIETVDIYDEVRRKTLQRPNGISLVHIRAGIAWRSNLLCVAFRPFVILMKKIAG